MLSIQVKKRIAKIFFAILVAYTAVSAALVALNALGVIMVVEGTSMVPTYHDGDLLILHRDINKSQLQIGEIIIFHNPNRYDQLIVHRVIEHVVLNSQLYFRTKGDNNPVADPWNVPENYVIASVSVEVPYLGQMLILIYNPVVRVAIAGLAFVFILVEVFYGKSS
ncbi:MAG: signal peptidase [Thermoproteota archaeon]|nr:signal peptidase [Thermoproteota archaeon]